MTRGQRRARRANYLAYFTRAERFCLIWVPAVNRTTAARHEGAIELMARDLIAAVKDVARDSFDVTAVERV
ncbi:hypothetical protein [Marmoricola sp. RAF53]|uniref:hypothetical protein n=1 Tax=Marmoricola sp. RAF53 TaxID=3233059 RepID=UPI003F98E386